MCLGSFCRPAIAAAAIFRQLGWVDGVCFVCDVVIPIGFGGRVRPARSARPFAALRMMPHRDICVAYRMLTDRRTKPQYFFYAAVFVYRFAGLARYVLLFFPDIRRRVRLAFAPSSTFLAAAAHLL